jgi:hypothetical protein
MAVTRKPLGSRRMVNARGPRFRYAMACWVAGGSAGFQCRESEVFLGRVGSSSRASKPLELARSHGFSARELSLIRRLAGTHLTAILEAWYEHCG